APGAPAAGYLCPLDAKFAGDTARTRANGRSIVPGGDGVCCSGCYWFVCGTLVWGGLLRCCLLCWRFGCFCRRSPFKRSSFAGLDNKAHASADRDRITGLWAIGRDTQDAVFKGLDFLRGFVALHREDQIA